MTCGNCGATLPDGAKICPNCGWAVPPDPVLVGEPVPPGRMTTRQKVEYGLGVLFGFVSPVVVLVGYLIFIVVYFINRSKKTPFNRGLGVGLILATLALAGAFAVCLYSVVRP